jgi:magnesium chelatase family protein
VAGLTPGEVILATRGILFLDELAAFPPAVVEALRQPLEERAITLQNVENSVVYPANFQLIASSELCQLPLSGPILDRFDLVVQLERDANEECVDSQAESSRQVRQRVERARALQRERFAGMVAVECNAHMGPGDVQSFCQIDASSRARLEVAVRRGALSARANHRLLKVARTIADLAGSAAIEPPHVEEALQVRPA